MADVMQRLLRSATLKLTGWYLLIIMIISVTFSIVIYQLNYREVSYRLENLQHSILDDVDAPTPLSAYLDIFTTGPDSPLASESRQASNQMILSLLYSNIVILIAGGFGSYFLAKRTLRPVAEAHEAQSRFTSDASHELRTPLSAMKTELEVYLRDKNLTLQEARELLDSNLEEVNKLIKLSEMLLKLSRLEHNELEVDMVDVSILLEELLKRYPSEMNRFKVTARKKAEIRGNEAAINELMQILVDNALNYSPKKSPIYIHLFQQRGRLVFEIKNKGKKIPDDRLPKIFDRFYRVDTSRTNGSKNGYGLGLSIAKKIVDIHRGDLTVSSSDEETIFTFYLPIVKKTP